ncbi:actin cytoskeleton-regulatory complex protein pan1 isoform X1 [Senna tora]|uniref:Actin cytoskeleton-regulatory complex protein pan1 isoform X1 n=1 Tax=Senna tora TaxID=362788 RepID=A0A834T953_9FABA|nr:actin cytoskeleton-regulatory complex protein pan1 isoform X1 [Senna tora]
MAGPNMDQFEAYFRRADLDGDGRISGAEAVSFFQGSNLPKHVLAQIWMHADQAKTGFLGRTEFYNALKLVTVAQSKRELTPDIVKAALYGPAAAKIPAPQINLSVLPPPLPNSVASAPASQTGASRPVSSQSFSYTGQGLSGQIVNQMYTPSPQNQTMRPSQPMPASSASRPQQGIAGPDPSRGVGMAGHNLSNPSMLTDWNSGRPSTITMRPGGITPSVPLSTSTSQAPVSSISQPTNISSKTLSVSGNGFSPNSAFGNDLFSAASSIPKQEPAGQNYSASSAPASSAIVPISSGAQPASKQNALDSLQIMNGQFQRTHPSANPNQQISAAASSSLTSSGTSAGPGNTNSDSSLLSWPKMKPSDVQKYTKVFMEVDTDRDGKITGEQARSLFLSWRLPIEVLKKVWDLSDQDNDSMLSLKEFCFALYLMERHREGRSLPPSLPSNVLYDETLLSMTGHPKISYGNAAWGAGPQQTAMPGARPVAPATVSRPPVQGTSSRVDDRTMQPNQQKSAAPVLEDSFLNQVNNGNQDKLNSKPNEATTAAKKVEVTENVILDSKEKLEFYRNKMQELVLYKSRCDNRLNEITERASADKREAESLAKKYEEKYKQVAEIASKLTIEEAKFRDIQERKTELQQAIIKMEQGGSSDGILQVRADRVQSDLEELLRALAERCKKHGIHVKSNAMVELPIGWQPGIPEGAAVWDEDWDKFEDEGFANDLTVDMKNVSAKPKPAINSEHDSADDNSIHGSPVHANEKKGNFTSNGDYAFEGESAYTHNEDDIARSSHDSPTGGTIIGSPPQEFSSVHFGKSSEADPETNRSFDESTWGVFDNNDDVDSVWGFNTANAKVTPESGLDKQRDFFKSGDFGINPVRTGSTHTDGTFQTRSPFTFDDSVPGTPLSKFGNSPRFSEAGDHFFDNMSRFDSFSIHDSGYSPQPERLTRFDSISSSRDFGYNNEKLTRFDSMSSSKDFGYTSERLTRFDSMNSSKDFGFSHDRHTRFDSISSTKDFGHSGAFSFDDSDPFGSSGPFKVSSESQTPKKGSDSWSAF